jgi:hypothetical protein
LSILSAVLPAVVTRFLRLRSWKALLAVINNRSSHGLDREFQGYLVASFTCLAK